MTGNIRKRGNRRYQVRISMGAHPTTGKRRRHEKTIHGSRSDAERYMRDFIQAYETGKVVRPSSQPLKEYLLQKPANMNSVWSRSTRCTNRLVDTVSQSQIIRQVRNLVVQCEAATSMC